jgi:hypothetical protein
MSPDIMEKINEYGYIILLILFGLLYAYLRFKAVTEPQIKAIEES